MTEYREFAAIRSENSSIEGNRTPSTSEYFVLKLAENWFAIAMIILTVLFFFVGVFCSDKSVKEYSFWSSSCCFGVFLGLGAKEVLK